MAKFGEQLRTSFERNVIRTKSALPIRLPSGQANDDRSKSGSRNRFSNRPLVNSFSMFQERLLNSLPRKKSWRFFNFDSTPVWPDDQIVFSIFGQLQQWKFAQKHTNCAKVSWKLCPKPNILPNIFKYLPKWWSFAKSGHTAYHRIANGFLKLGQPRPLFVLFKYNFAEKMFGIWTWIVRLEGEHPDHLTTTTAQGFT